MEIENKILVVKELPDGSPVRIPYFIVDSKTKGHILSLRVGGVIARGALLARITKD